MSNGEDNSWLNAKYQERLVAFVDILGWKSLIAKSVTDSNILTNMAILSRAQNGMGQIFAGANGIRHIRMSDASVFVADPNDQAQVFTIVFAIQQIHQTALMAGWLARGSVVLGQIYCSETTPTILGPALTAAYLNSENGLAHFPRTIVDVDSADLISNSFSESNVHIKFKGLFPKTNGVPLVRDSDDITFVSYLGGFLESIQKEHFRDKIRNGMSEYKENEKVYQKYYWLKNYFNATYGEDI